MSDEAERLRRRSMRTVYARVATLIAVPLALVALIPSLIGIVVVDRQNTKLEKEIASRCVEGKVNRNAIRESIFDGLAALGYRYDPETDLIVSTETGPIAYYQTHPAERDAALDRTIRSLDRFPPITC